MPRKVITPAMKNEVVDMTNRGCSNLEICETVGISKATLSRIRKERGLKATGGRGGVISRTIPAYELERGFKSEESVAEDDDVPIVIADQLVLIAGTETATQFKCELRKDTVSVEGDLVVGEVRIDQLLSLSKELKAVYNLAMRMKGNRFEIAK